MPDEILMSTLSTLGIVGGGGTLVAWFVASTIKKAKEDLEKIPTIEQRVAALEQQAAQHNETKYAVIRVEEQIKHLTEEVRELKDLLMRKVFNTND